MNGKINITLDEDATLVTRVALKQAIRSREELIGNIGDSYGTLLEEKKLMETALHKLETRQSGRVEPRNVSARHAAGATA